MSITSNFCQQGPLNPTEWSLANVSMLTHQSKMVKMVNIPDEHHYVSPVIMNLLTC